MLHYLFLTYYYHNCHQLLSTPHDFCLCIKKSNVFIQKDNGYLERWLKLNKKYVVQEIYPVETNGKFIFVNIQNHSPSNLLSTILLKT